MIEIKEKNLWHESCSKNISFSSSQRRKKNLCTFHIIIKVQLKSLSWDINWQIISNKLCA
jgi:hypothetical protein